MAEPEVLEAPNILEYPYARSVGPIDLNGDPMAALPPELQDLTQRLAALRGAL